MSNPKVFFVLLGLVAVLFVAVLLWGGGNEGEDRDPFEAMSEIPGWMRSLGDRFSAWGPRLKLAQDRFSVQADKSSALIAVSSSDEDVRKATFRLVDGQSVVIVYQTPSIGARRHCVRPGDPPKPSKSGKLPPLQVIELPREVEDPRQDPRVASLAVPGTKGQIRIDCCGNRPCELRLE